MTPQRFALVNYAGVMLANLSAPEWTDKVEEAVTVTVDAPAWHGSFVRTYFSPGVYWELQLVLVP